MLAVIARAARTRRTRAASRLLWRIAPFVAAGALAAAALARWTNGPAIVAPALLGAFALAWGAFVLIEQRRVRISDATAAAVDADANLGGELRSAAWFAVRGAKDSWAAYHVDRAADRLEALDLARLYPPVAARRARLATGAMAAIALVMVATFPERPHAGPAQGKATPQRAKVPSSSAAIDGVPAELPQELEELLASIEAGTPPTGNASDAALQGTLTKLQALNDPRALAALAKAMAADRSRQDNATMKELADRAKRDAALTPPSDIRNALEELSKKLSDPEHELDAPGFEKGDEAEPQGGVDLAGATPQSSRDATAIAGLGMVSLAKQEAADPNAPPGVGVGGASSTPGEGGTMPDMAKALRHEVVEAHDDDLSSDVKTDARRKTERGQATAAYTGGATGTFDAARASAPPPVPESRRAGIQTYFSRKQ